MGIQSFSAQRKGATYTKLNIRRGYSWEEHWDAEALTKRIREEIIKRGYEPVGQFWQKPGDKKLYTFHELQQPIRDRLLNGVEEKEIAFDDMTITEKCDTIEKLVKEGLEIVDIAKRIEKSKTYVYQIMHKNGYSIQDLRRQSKNLTSSQI